MSNENKQDTDGLTDLLCFSIYSAGHAFNHLYRPLLEELGLTYPQYLAMRLLWVEDNCSVKSLSQALRLESNTLTPLLKRLEALNLVKRHRDAEDERIVRIRLTDEGRTMEVRAEDIPRCVGESTGLTEKDLRELIRQINQLRDRLLGAAQN